MNASYFTNPLIFIINSVLSLYVLAVMLRFLLQWSRADTYNPVFQFLLKITHPPLKLLRRYIPSIGKIDTSSLVLALTLQMAMNFLKYALQGMSISIGALTLLSLSQLIELLFDIFIFAIIIRAILSWINPRQYDSFANFLGNLTEPMLDTCRKFVPDFGGVDISPLAALLLLNLAKMVILPPIEELARLIS